MIKEVGDWSKGRNATWYSNFMMMQYKNQRWVEHFLITIKVFVQLIGKLKLLVEKETQNMDLLFLLASKLHVHYTNLYMELTVFRWHVCNWQVFYEYGPTWICFCYWWDVPKSNIMAKGGRVVSINSWLQISMWPPIYSWCNWLHT